MVITDLADSVEAIDRQRAELAGVLQGYKQLVSVALEEISRLTKLVERQSGMIQRQAETIQHLTGLNPDKTD